ncbi:MAG: hypothetical protein R2708_03620 [Vicinamibacterales bacterium]
MSVRFRSVTAFESSVSARFPIECQKYRTRCPWLWPRKREP